MVIGFLVVKEFSFRFLFFFSCCLTYYSVLVGYLLNGFSREMIFFFYYCINFLEFYCSSDFGPPSSFLCNSIVLFILTAWLFGFCFDLFFFSFFNHFNFIGCNHESRVISGNFVQNCNTCAFTSARTGVSLAV